jgi:hypothetical protein
MKTLKLKDKFFLKKEKIVTLNKEQLSIVKGGGTITWLNCPRQGTVDCWGPRAENVA